MANKEQFLLEFLVDMSKAESSLEAFSARAKSKVAELQAQAAAAGKAAVPPTQLAAARAEDRGVVAGLRDTGVISPAEAARQNRLINEAYRPAAQAQGLDVRNLNTKEANRIQEQVRASTVQVIQGNEQLAAALTENVGAQRANTKAEVAATAQKNKEVAASEKLTKEEELARKKRIAAQNAADKRAVLLDPEVRRARDELGFVQGVDKAYMDEQKKAGNLAARADIARARTAEEVATLAREEAAISADRIITGRAIAQAEFDQLRSEKIVQGYDRTLVQLAGEEVALAKARTGLIRSSEAEAFRSDAALGGRGRGLRDAVVTGRVDQFRESTIQSVAYERQIAADGALLAAKAEETALKTKNTLEEKVMSERILAADSQYLAALSEQAAIKQANALREAQIAGVESNIRAQAATNIQRRINADRLAAQEKGEMALNEEALKVRAQRVVNERIYNIALEKQVREAAIQAGIQRPGLLGRVFSGGGGYGGAGGNDGSASSFFGGGLRTTLRYALPSLALFGAIGGISSIVREAEELEAIFVRVEAQLQDLDRAGDLPQFKKSIFDISEATGVSADQIAVLQSQFLGAFTNINPETGRTESASTDLVSQAASLAAQIGVVGELEPQEIFNDLIAGARAFATDDSPEAVIAVLEQIGDQTIALRNRTGVAGKELIDFVGRIGPIAAQAGASLEEVEALGASLLQGSAVPGATLAEQFGRVLSEFRSNTGPELVRLFQNEGISIDVQAVAEGDAFAVLDDLATGFDSLTEAQRRNLIAQIGQRREGAVIATFLQNRRVFLDSVTAAEEAAGTTAEEFAKKQETLSFKLSQLKVAFEELGLSIFESGLGDILKDIVSAVASLVNLLDLLVQGFEALPDGVKDSVVILGEFYALYKLISALQGGGGRAGAAGLGGLLLGPGFGQRIRQGGLESRTNRNLAAFGATYGLDPQLSGIGAPAATGSFAQRARQRIASSVRDPQFRSLGLFFGATMVAGFLDSIEESNFKDSFDSRKAQLDSIVTRIQSGIIDPDEVNELIAEFTRTEISNGSLIRSGTGRDRFSFGDKGFAETASQAVDAINPFSENFLTAPDDRLSQAELGERNASAQAFAEAYGEMLQERIDQVISVDDETFKSIGEFRGYAFEQGLSDVTNTVINAQLENEPGINPSLLGGPAAANFLGSQVAVDLPDGREILFTKAELEEAWAAFQAEIGGEVGALSNQQADIVAAFFQAVNEQELPQPIKDALAGTGIDPALQDIGQSVQDVDAAKELFSAGVIPLAEMENVLRSEIEFLEQFEAFGQTDVERIKVIAELRGELAGVAADAATEAAEFQGILRGFRGEGEQEVQVDTLTGLLSDPDVLGDPERVRSIVTELVEAEQAILRETAENAGSEAEAIAILRAGRQLTPQTQTALIYAELTQAGSAFNNFLATWVEGGLEVSDAMMMELAEIIQEGGDAAEFVRQNILRDQAEAQAALLAGSLGLETDPAALVEQLSSVSENADPVTQLLELEGILGASLGELTTEQNEVYNKLIEIINLIGSFSGDGGKAKLKGLEGILPERTESVYDAEALEDRLKEDQAAVDDVADARANYFRALYADDPGALAAFEISEANRMAAEATNEAERWNAAAAQINAQRQFREYQEEIRDARRDYMLALVEEDPLAAAQLELQFAMEDRANAKNEVEAWAAAVAIVRAQRAVEEEQRAIRDAQLEVQRARAENDPVALARLEQQAADQAMADARSASERLQAEAQRIRADRAFAEAVQDIFSARNEYLMALADYSGDAVESARLGLAAAQQQLKFLQSQGAGEAEINRAKAEIVRAQGNLRDTELQSRLDNYQFLFDMEKISKQQFIAYLQSLKSIPDLTEQQIRDIDRQIKQLKDSLGQDLQFNLPSQLQLPTLYEVRRLSQSVNPDKTSMPGGYQDNRVVDIRINVNNGTDEARMVSIIEDAVGTSRFGVKPRRY